jgi:hypothetical protein
VEPHETTRSLYVKVLPIVVEWHLTDLGQPRILASAVSYLLIAAVVLRSLLEYREPNTGVSILLGAFIALVLLEPAAPGFVAYMLIANARFQPVAFFPTTAAWLVLPLKKSSIEATQRGCRKILFCRRLSAL